MNHENMFMCFHFYNTLYTYETSPGTNIISHHAQDIWQERLEEIRLLELLPN